MLWVLSAIADGAPASASTSASPAAALRPALIRSLLSAAAEYRGDRPGSRTSSLPCPRAYRDGLARLRNTSIAASTALPRVARRAKRLAAVGDHPGSLPSATSIAIHAARDRALATGEAAEARRRWRSKTGSRRCRALPLDADHAAAVSLGVGDRGLDRGAVAAEPAGPSAPNPPDRRRRPSHRRRATAADRRAEGHRPPGVPNTARRRGPPKPPRAKPPRRGRPNAAPAAQATAGAAGAEASHRRQALAGPPVGNVPLVAWPSVSAAHVAGAASSAATADAEHAVRTRADSVTTDAITRRSRRPDHQRPGPRERTVERAEHDQLGHRAGRDRDRRDDPRDRRPPRRASPAPAPISPALNGARKAT